MKKTGKRWLAALLAAIMVIGLLPTSALAADALTTSNYNSSTDYSGYGFVFQRKQSGYMPGSQPTTYVQCVTSSESSYTLSEKDKSTANVQHYTFILEKADTIEHSSKTYTTYKVYVQYGNQKVYLAATDNGSFSLTTSASQARLFTMDVRGSGNSKKLVLCNISGHAVEFTEYWFTNQSLEWCNSAWSSNCSNMYDLVGAGEIAKTYKVTYDSNGATSGSVPTDNKQYAANVTVTVLGNTGSLAKTGSTFKGWSYGGKTYAAGETFTMPENDVTLTAVWESNQTYSTSYSWTNDDKLVSAPSLPTNGSGYTSEDAAIASMSTATYEKQAGKDGYYYTFSSWTAGTTTGYVVPFTGTWTKTSEKVTEMWATVKYVINSGNGKINDGQTTEFSVLKNTAWTEAGITDPTTTADTGYKFDGWSTKPETITKDETITGTFSINSDSTHEIGYTVEYYQDDVIVSADTQTEKQTVQVLQNTLTVDSSKINTTNKYTGYVFEKTEPATIPATIAAGGTIKVYYTKDVKGGKDNDGKDEGDNIPDKYQVFVEYVSADTFKGTVDPTWETITLKDNDGKYVASKDNVTATGSTATPVTGNAFDYWTKKVDSGDEATVALDAKTGTINLGTVTGGSEITFTAYFDTDVIGGKDDDGNDTGDGTPDKYQATVTYRVVNGKWADTNTDTDRKSVFKLKEKDATTGKWEPFNPAPTLGDTFPDVIANDGYTSVGGGWNPECTEGTTVTGDATYTYTFVKIGSATFNPNTVTWEGQDGKHTGIFFKKLTGTLPSGYSETFEITLTEVPKEIDGSPGNIEIDPNGGLEVVEPESTVYKGKVTMTAAGTEQFICDTMTFNQPGDYIFIVKETEGTNKSYITYDSNEYELHITVAAKTENTPQMDMGKFRPDLKVRSAEETEKTTQLEITHWFIQGGNNKDEGQQQVTFENSSSYTAPVYVPYVPTTINVKGLDTVNHVAYIVGVGKNLVNPLGTITRAEVATIYFRLMTDEWRSLYWSNTNSYTDVTADKWYNVAVSTLEKAGIIKDTATGGAFRPNDPITRAELAVMAAQFCTVTGTIPRTSFADVSTAHWAYKEIALIEYAGWIEGYAGYFYPDQNLSRAECVTIVNRMLNRGAEPKDMLNGMVTFQDNLNPDAWYYAAIQEAVNGHTYGRTGKLLTGETCIYAEKWNDLLPATDWAALEAAWTQAYKAD